VPGSDGASALLLLLLLLLHGSMHALMCAQLHGKCSVHLV
jgi:hypothetical protein